MGHRRTFLPPKRRLRLIEHKVALERSYPDAYCDLKQGVLVWKAVVRPTVLSRKYQVKIWCKQNNQPRVVVSGDSLRGLSKSDFPHKYEIDQDHRLVRVCLYLPSEFDHMQPFSDTIVPWAIEWLLHYEIWLATGEWRGGGVHPMSGRK